MGSTAKSLMRLLTLTATGDLKPGSTICDIGATQLFGGDAAEPTARAFLDYYAERLPAAKHSKDVPDAKIKEISNGGMLGDLLILSGFKYTALDIFHATNTIIFDLNIHAPGPRLRSHFDLVMNFGTTEHVINQLRAFQTIHDLTKVGGVIYHDLPMGGYLNHALFRYDPLFFRTVIPANDYAPILQVITVGNAQPVPDDVASMGFGTEPIKDVGIEIIVRRVNDNPFKVPMETSTSLSIDPNFHSVTESEMVVMPTNSTVTYGQALNFDGAKFEDLARACGRRIVDGIRRRVGL